MTSSRKDVFLAAMSPNKRRRLDARLTSLLGGIRRDADDEFAEIFTF